MTDNAREDGIPGAAPPELFAITNVTALAQGGALHRSPFGRVRVSTALNDRQARTVLIDCSKNDQ